MMVLGSLKKETVLPSLQVLNSDEVQDVAVPCLLPHEVLHAVACAGADQVGKTPKHGGIFFYKTKWDLNFGL